jgi:hypothetical protein
VNIMSNAIAHMMISLGKSTDEIDIPSGNQARKRSVRAGLPEGCLPAIAGGARPPDDRQGPPCEWVLPVAGGVCARPGWCRIKDAHPDERTTA